MNASSIFLWMVGSLPTKTFLTTCWVIVEPPRRWSLTRLSTAAEKMAVNFSVAGLDADATAVVTFSDGTRHLITALGANADLRLSDVPAAWIAGPRHVHRSGYWWATGLIGPPSAKLLARARKAGATTSLDTATDPEGWPQSRRRAVLSVLPHVDMYFGNEEEVCRLADDSSIEAAAWSLLDTGVGEVVVHQGDRGATVFTRTGVATARALSAAPVNPTGCGDVFNAAYVFASLAGADAMGRLRFANAAAAWHIENLARPYPTRRDLRARFSVRLPEGPSQRP